MVAKRTFVCLQFCLYSFIQFSFSVNGVRYFDCGNKYGSFIVPSAVEIGDFPELNDGLDDDEI